MNSCELIIWTKFWKNVEKHNYNSLNKSESIIMRDIHLKNLYKVFGHDGQSFTLPVSIYDIPFLSGYERIVIGNHGAYIEFTESQLLLEIATKIGQEYRESVSGSKYLWKNPIIDGSVIDIKIYQQTRTVNYADYKVGFYYVDPYELFFSKDMLQYVTEKSIL